ncbi:MAG: BatA domain-containing protein, partial [Dokdonia sp.]|nr:BatA domain-containing protein [Dokdonia sp.]
MTLLQPSYLWGLLALAIPIAIHLWSRKKVRTIKMGSTRFISETKSNQSNSIQLNEWWLLAIRCLIISTLVFILSEPYSSKKQEQQDVVYVFEPSLLATEDGRARFIEIPETGRRLLRSGFPEWQVDSDMMASDAVPNYWQLAKQMEQLPADSVVVFTRAFAKAVKGKRPEIASHITWIPVDVESTANELLLAIAKKDSIAVLTVQKSPTKLAFAKTKLSNN